MSVDVSRHGTSLESAAFGIRESIKIARHYIAETVFEGTAANGPIINKCPQLLVSTKYLRRLEVNTGCAPPERGRPS
jgi:hypothetical protein